MGAFILLLFYNKKGGGNVCDDLFVNISKKAYQRKDQIGICNIITFTKCTLYIRKGANQFISTDLARVVNYDAESDSSAGDVAANTTFSRQSLGVRVGDCAGAGSDDRAARVGILADLHALDSLVGSLGLNGRHIVTGPATVCSVSEVELAPGSAVATIAVGRNRSTGSSSKTTVGVLVEGNVLGLTSFQGETQGRVAIPAIHLSIRTDLVPENNLPGLGVLAGNLGHIFVLRGIAGGDLNDVATPRITNVASVGVAAAAGASSGTEALGRVDAVRGNGCPV